MASPALPRYGDTPFIAVNRPGVVAALKHGIKATLPPTVDGTPYTQRDLNEMIDRGWVTRFRQRPEDKAWSYALTKQGGRVAEELGLVG